MVIVFSIVISLVIGYAIGRFIEAKKSENEKRQIMLELGNTVDNARNKANKRWGM